MGEPDSASGIKAVYPEIFLDKFKVNFDCVLYLNSFAFFDVTDAIKEIPYVCGYCYTQITDVQQEINGLLDSERNFKIDPILIKEINDRQKTGSY